MRRNRNFVIKFFYNIKKIKTLLYISIHPLPYLSLSFYPHSLPFHPFCSSISPFTFLFFSKKKKRKKMEFLMILCVTLLTYSITNFIINTLNKMRHQNCYLIDYACFKPSDEFKLPTNICGEVIQRNKILGFDEYKFLLKIMINSGIGEETYGPRSIFRGEEATSTFDDALFEMDECFEHTIGDVLTSSGVKPTDIDILVVNVSMFAPEPSLASRIVNKFKMRDDIKIYNLSGMGCSASLVSVDLIRRTFMSQFNKLALIFTSESITPNWYSGNNRSMLLANCLFRCGGCAMLLTNDPKRKNQAKLKLKHLIRTDLGANDEAFNCAYEKEDELGHTGMCLSKYLVKAAALAFMQNLKILAPKVLPVTELVRFVMAGIYGRIKVSSGAGSVSVNFKAGIDHFVIHSGGAAVIDGVGRSLRLSEWDLQPARMTLNRFGNTSASSIWYALGYMEAKKRLKKGEIVFMIGFGAGFMGNSCVWIVNRDLKDEGVWKECIDQYPPKKLENPFMNMKMYGWINDQDI
ncbi:putative very-long-chain 3-oxoacyl-CoA synthase [Dioscorea sansibarensis]